jgi:hypothetical protein
MKTVKETLLERYLPTTSEYERELWYNTNDWSTVVVSIMKQYAVEAINELVDEMLAYPPNELSESANLIQIANKIKRQIHGVSDKTEDHGSRDKVGR